MPRKKSSPWERVVGRARRSWAWLAPVLKTRQFWLGGLIALTGLSVTYLLFDRLVMPTYTRQGIEVIVPEVRELPFDEAVRLVEGRGLRAERRDQPFNPGFTRHVVLDQNPAPNAAVKPGRRVYLYVNTGTERTVTMLEVRTLTERVARAELAELGLVHVETRVDDRPSPYAGTITRQQPESGAAVRTSETVTLWVSPGLGDQTVEVPDVRGLAFPDALAALERAGLWVDPTRAVSGTITRQEPAAHALVQQGTEVRLSSVPIEGRDLPEALERHEYQEYEEGIPPFIEVPPGEPIPDIDEPRRDPERIDW